MEEIKLFRILNRVNSVLFLIILLGVSLFTLFVLLTSNSWRDNGTVEVSENPEDKNSPKIELILNNIQDICGHNIQYIELKAKSRGGSFSSGYSSGETRNVLFLIGKQLDTKWLFIKHSNLIKSVIPLKSGYECKKNVDIAVYYNLINKDTNKDGVLDSDDLSTLALTKPDGSQYTVLDSNIQSIIDRTVINKGKSLALLTQKKNKVHFKIYSLETFKLISSKIILDIAAGT